MTEAQAIAILCAMFMGEEEVRLDYALGWIRMDCVTETHVIEVGLDSRSSLDSLQQATFAATLIDREPMVLIVDTDGRVGRYEYRIREAARASGVTYLNLKLEE